ncbi:MAG: histidinol-phosphate transaminase [Candidatus Binataceae bacterium]
MKPKPNKSALAFRPAILRMTPYAPGEQPRAGERLIKLNTNENPYPPSPGVRRALAEMPADVLRLYPSPRADPLIAKAAEVYGIPSEMILAGNGSDELLAMLFRATLDKGDRAAWPLPTYSLYDTLAAEREAQVIAIPWRRGFRLPLDELADAHARLTIVCNPNAPSGNLTPVPMLERLARRIGERILVIDEAYVDFADANALGLVRRHPNVVVLRTFSKSYSLAGMRLGLCFAHPEIIENLLKVKDSYNLNRVAIAAGVRALTDMAWMRRNVARVRRTRRRTEIELRRIGFEVPASQANFVMARISGRDLGPLAAGLRERGILVRHFATPELRDSLRISIGKPDEMAALFKALRTLAAPLVSSKRDSMINPSAGCEPGLR